MTVAGFLHCHVGKRVLVDGQLEFRFFDPWSLWVNWKVLKIEIWVHSMYSDDTYALTPESSASFVTIAIPYCWCFGNPKEQPGMVLKPCKSWSINVHHINLRTHAGCLNLPSIIWLSLTSLLFCAFFLGQKTKGVCFSTTIFGSIRWCGLQIWGDLVTGRWFKGPTWSIPGQT